MIATAELMAYTRAASVDEDLVRSLERAAVATVEEESGLYLRKEGEITENRIWRGWPLELATTPAGTVVIERQTGSGWETVDAGSYQVDGPMVWGVGTAGETWGTSTRIRATYTGGYAEDAVDEDAWDAPEMAKQAVRSLTEHWYSNRGAVGRDSEVQEIPLGVRALIRALRRTTV